MSITPFSWLYGDEDHPVDNLAKVTGLLKILCETDLRELDDDGHSALHLLLRAIAGVTEATYKQILDEPPPAP